jgi:N-acetylmuramoyl-L-alanine amidase
MKRFVILFSFSFFLFSMFFLNNSLFLAKNKLEVIVIDAGHGGKDPGTISNSGIKEKIITLSIALKFGELIQQNFPSIKIIYTRKTDEFIEVRDRTAIANNNKANLFISIHVNHKKEEETEKNGFEIYLLNKERYPEAIAITEKENTVLKYQQENNNENDKYIFSALSQTGYLKFGEYLTHNIEFNLLDVQHLASRGAMQAGFWVLLASMPSILIETGYISDPNDEKLLSSFDGQSQIAKALLQGFSAYKLIYEMVSN